MYIETETARCVSMDWKNKYIKTFIGTFDEIKNSVDLVIAIGGDGTLLGLARQFAQFEAHVSELIKDV